MNIHETIADFFDAFTLDSSKQHLKDWLECALTTDNPYFSDPLERANIITFSEKLNNLLQAAYDQHVKNKKV